MPIPDTYVSAAAIEIEIGAAQGAAGDSAYQSYVNTTSDDPVKTEEEWLASLVGPPGTTDYNNLENKPTLGTAAAKNIPATGNASATEVVYGSDTRLTDSRTPTAHKSSHTTGGSDALTPADIGAAPSYPRAIAVTGTLTDGTDAVVFPVMPAVSELHGYPSYQNGSYSAIPAILENLDGSFTFQEWQFSAPYGSGSSAVWSSTTDTKDPTTLVDLAPTAPSTGSPGVTSADIVTAESVEAAGAAMAGHTHVKANITDFPILGTAAAADTGTTQGKVPLLSAGGSFVISGINASIETTGEGGYIRTVGLNGYIETYGRLAHMATLGGGYISASGNLICNRIAAGIGTVSVSAGTPTVVTGVGTRFQDWFVVGDRITIAGQSEKIIASIDSQTQLTVSVAYGGAVASTTYTTTTRNSFTAQPNGNATITGTFTAANVTGTNTGDETAAAFGPKISTAGDIGAIDDAADMDAIAVLDQSTTPAFGLKKLSFANLKTWLGSWLDAVATIAGAKTFSGQMQFTGQSATDANSAMTRGLVDARFPQFVTSSTARTRSTQNAYADDEDLTINLDANSAYYFDLHINVTHATSSNLGLKIKYAGTINGTAFQVTNFVNQSGAVAQIRWTAVTAGSVTEITSTGSNSIRVYGIVPTGTSGALTFQLANTAATGTVTRTFGSLMYKKL